VSIFPEELKDKHCFIYCGKEHCNCRAGNPNLFHVNVEPKTPLAKEQQEIIRIALINSVVIKGKNKDKGEAG